MRLAKSDNKYRYSNFRRNAFRSMASQTAMISEQFHLAACFLHSCFYDFDATYPAPAPRQPFLWETLRDPLLSPSQKSTPLNQRIAIPGPSISAFPSTPLTLVNCQPIAIRDRFEFPWRLGGREVDSSG